MFILPGSMRVKMSTKESDLKGQKILATEMNQDHQLQVLMMKRKTNNFTIKAKKKRFLYIQQI
jgi:hypothetical protein